MPHAARQRGHRACVARVSVINYYGFVELDELVQQKERVVDYRTKWSGIRPQDMVRGELISSTYTRLSYNRQPSTARPFEEVQKKVANLIEGKILVGHAVHNDLKVPNWFLLFTLSSSYFQHRPSCYPTPIF